jgi:hypothetical protein
MLSLFVALALGQTPADDAKYLVERVLVEMKRKDAAGVASLARLPFVSDDEVFQEKADVESHFRELFNEDYDASEIKIKEVVSYQKYRDKLGSRRDAADKVMADWVVLCVSPVDDDPAAVLVRFVNGKPWFVGVID